MMALPSQLCALCGEPVAETDEALPRDDDSDELIHWSCAERAWMAQEAAKVGR